MRHAVALLILLVLTVAARGQGLLIAEPTPDRTDPIQLKSHQVDVAIHDQIATTTVEHVFHNPSSVPREAHFIFPLPAGAQVDKITMAVNGVQTEAELLDAGKARRIYEDIVRKMRDPALLEYADDGLIRARIFPVEPRRDQRITVTYTTLLPASGGLIRYDYPLTQHQAAGASITRLALRIQLQTTAPLATIYSPSHAMQITRPDDHRAVVGLETDQAGERAVQLLFAPQAQAQDDLALTLLTCRDDPDEPGYFMLLAAPQARQDQAPSPPKSVVFVLDTSGSMQGEKLEQARRALRYCVANLNPADRFQLIRFSTDIEPLFEKLMLADKPRQDEAIDFIDELKAGGGTAIHDALQAAQQAIDADPAGGGRYIVFLTDGQPTIGQTDHDAILQALTHQAGSARIFCFGVGTDINTKLLDRIAEQTRAATEYVLPEEDLEVKLADFSSKIDLPALTDLQVSVTGGVKLKDFHPAALPDLFHGGQLVLFGRYENAGDATLTLTGTRGEDRQVHERTVTFEAHDTRHAFIPRMWATRRVGFLLDEIRLHGENDELREEVVRLARRFAILTPYTSYLIVEDEKRRDVPLAMQSLGDVQNQRAARQAVAMEYADMLDADTGRAGIAGSRNNAQMQAAASLQPAPASITAAPARPGLVQQATRVIGRRAFVQNGPRWIDTQVQQMPHADVRRISFGSDAYFQLLRDHPEAAAWLSVGKLVTFQLGDAVIEVVEAP